MGKGDQNEEFPPFTLFLSFFALLIIRTEIGYLTKLIIG